VEEVRAKKKSVRPPSEKKKSVRPPSDRRHILVQQQASSVRMNDHKVNSAIQALNQIVGNLTVEPGERERIELLLDSLEHK
jgi:hypothetical protein